MHALIEWLDNPDKEPIISGDEENMLEALRQILSELKENGWKKKRENEE